MHALPPSDPAIDAAEARAKLRFEVLGELTQIGMGLARDVGRQAAEPADPDAPPVDLGLQFSRIARAVRQTVALEAKFDSEREARQAKAEADRAAETRLRGIRRKTRVGDIVERIIDEESDSERLIETLSERLEDADDTDFADRPLGEIVAAICRDLGVTVDWTLWEEQPWAAEALGAEGTDAPPPDLPAAANAPPAESPQAWSG
jgi:CRISPR/Cas system CSM-associated protein Csm2 small subunit